MLEKTELTDKTFLIHKETILSYIGMVFKKVKNCPTPECINKIITDKEDETYKCYCGFAHEISCSTHHKNMTCKEFKEKEIDLIEKNYRDLRHDQWLNVAPCPQQDCRGILQKNYCNIVTCNLCNKTINWKTVSYNIKTPYSKDSKDRVYIIKNNNFLDTF